MSYLYNFRDTVMGPIDNWIPMRPNLDDIIFAVKKSTQKGLFSCRNNKNYWIGSGLFSISG